MANSPHQVFHVLNGVVDDDADRQQQTSRDHHVDIDAALVQHEQGGKQRQRNRQCCDQSRAPVAHQYKNRRYQQHVRNQDRGGKVPGSPLNKTRWPVDGGVNLNAFHALPQLHKRGFDAAGYIHRVGSRKFFDHQHEPGAILQNGVSNERLAVFLDRGDVAQGQRSPENRHLGETFCRHGGRNVTHPKSLVRGVDEPA